MNTNQINRGDVFLVDLGEGNGSEQGGIRPVVVVQNNIGNKFAPTIIVACITSKQSKKPMPTHLSLSKEQYETPDHCVVLMEQVRTIDKSRIVGNKLFSLNDMDKIRLDRAIQISFGLVTPTQPRRNVVTA